MFSTEVISQLVSVARAKGIDPPSLFAIVETESNGHPFEADGTTPCFLFERHIFYRELKRRNPDKLAYAVSHDMAISSRQDGQYRDEGTSAGRMKLLLAARTIDSECANRACSWGIGQILGANAEDLGYSSATQMVESMSHGIVGQVEGMIRFITKNRLIPYLNMHDWASFALHYNGAAYRSNHYDTKMAAYYRQWAAKLDAMAVPPPAPETPAEPEPSEPEEPEDLPPPYIEPKTPVKSKTLWAGGIQILSVCGAYIGQLMSDWRIVASFLVVIVFLALFIGRERILKIIETNT